MPRNSTFATTQDVRNRTAPEGDTTQETQSQAWPATATPARRRPKVLLSLRIDHDVQEYFRTQGPGYQTRMNAVLRAYMEHVRKQHAKGGY